MEKLIPGLEGVPIMESNVGFIDGQKGILEYRGIPIEELAAKSSYEEVAYLLLWGKLPTREQMSKFDHDLRTHRRVKFGIIDLMKCLPENGHPMDALQAAVAALGMFYPAKIDASDVPPGTDVLSQEKHYWSIIRLIAKLPTIVAAFERMRHGDERTHRLASARYGSAAARRRTIGGSLGAHSNFSQCRARPCPYR